jgi:RHS repeat-associated protein
VVNHLVYDAYGNVTSETNSAVESLFLFTARPLDPDTGLQNNLNRWYDPAVGRWLSEDPAQADINSYRYVGDNPIIFVDPSGLEDTITGTSPMNTFRLIWKEGTAPADFVFSSKDGTVTAYEWGDRSHTPKCCLARDAKYTAVGYFKGVRGIGIQEQLYQEHHVETGVAEYRNNVGWVMTAAGVVVLVGANFTPAGWATDIVIVLGGGVSVGGTVIWGTSGSYTVKYDKAIWVQTGQTKERCKGTVGYDFIYSKAGDPYEVSPEHCKNRKVGGIFPEHPVLPKGVSAPYDGPCDAIPEWASENLKGVPFVIYE